MMVKSGTMISASDVEVGMVVDVAAGRDLAYKRVTVCRYSDAPDDQVELTDHRGMSITLNVEDLVTIRGYFNPDID